MKIVIAPQSFKGALPAMEVARAIEAGVRSVFPDAETVLVPVADGGDGTLDVLVKPPAGEIFATRVCGPLGDKTRARWGAMSDVRTAVVEMALASGLALLPPGKRDPRRTSTFGTGQLLKEALERGYRRIIVGLGGSATNDGGAGMARALGARFLDAEGKDLPPGGAALAVLARIDVSDLHPALKEAEIIAATDVNNPLCGLNGASAVYGPQKGATPETVQELDRALQHYALIVRRDLGFDVADKPGAGAAGGLGAGLLVFANATIWSGIDLVCEALSLDDHLKGAHLVITGEGRIDASTVYNKAPVGVARRAKAHHIPVIALAGSLGRDYEKVYDYGIDAVVCIVDRPITIQESLNKTHVLLQRATQRTLRLLKLKFPIGV